MKRKKRDLAASVRQRLLDLTRERDGDFETILRQFGIERLLYRITRTLAAEEFVVKGALLFVLWTGKLHRATRDLDLLGRGAVDVARVVELFKRVCTAPVEEDGLSFDVDAMSGEPLRGNPMYGGVRLHLLARLGVARIPIQVDIGFGDSVTPSPRKTRFPTLLDFPAPNLKVYPREAVVAEKLHAMVSRGMNNTRLKDFYDLWILARGFEFDGRSLSVSIRATFQSRDTPLPLESPLALTDRFCDDPVKRVQWTAFVRKGRLQAAPSLSEIVSFLKPFLLPPINALVENRAFSMSWQPGGPWAS